jgi:hypothetical protein
MSRTATSAAAKAISPNATHDALNKLCPRRRAIWSANPAGTRRITAAMATATGNGTGCCAGKCPVPDTRLQTRSTRSAWPTRVGRDVQASDFSFLGWGEPRHPLCRNGSGGGSDTMHCSLSVAWHRSARSIAPGTTDDPASGRYCLNQAKAPVTGVTFDPVTGVRRSTAYRIRTGVTAVRGRRPRPLDECGTVAPRRADSSKRRLDAGWSRRRQLRSQPLGKQLAHPRPLVVGDRVPG